MTTILALTIICCIFMVVLPLMRSKRLRRLATETDNPQMRVTIEGSVTYSQQIVGESHYQEALRAMFKRYPDGTCEVTLVREPTNSHDPNAIRVDIDGQKVGYIPRQNIDEISRYLNGIKGRCPGKLYGGTNQKPHIGVWIDPVWLDYR